MSPGAPAGSVDPNATGTAAQATPFPLEEGDPYFGLIESVDEQKRTIIFDVGGFVEGKRANEIAAEDGVIKEGEKLETDYYVRNKVTYERTVPLAPDVKIRVVGDPPDLVDGELDDFAAAFESDETQPFGDGPSYRGENGKYWVTIEDDVVVMIEEQYIP